MELKEFVCAYCGIVSYSRWLKFGKFSLLFYECAGCGVTICNRCTHYSFDELNGKKLEESEKYKVFCKDCYDSLEEKYSGFWQEEYPEFDGSRDIFEDED